MKIKLRLNKKLFFLETILALTHPKEKHHSLATKILKHYKESKKIKSLKVFKDKINEGKLPRNNYYYRFFSIHLNPDLTSKKTAPKDGFGPKSKSFYDETLFPILKDIENEIKFNEYYEEEIKNKYQKLSQKFSKRINKDLPGKVLHDFWKDVFTPELIINLDPFRVNGGSSAARNEKFYSFSGANIYYQTNEIKFKTTSLISNMFHEFSHSYFQHMINYDKETWEKNNKLCKKIIKTIDLEKKEKVLKNFGRPEIFIEENFVRAVQIYLNYVFFSKFTGEEKAKQSVDSSLRSDKDNGFIFVDRFYKALWDNDPYESYMTILQ